jgi:hypothetical protein
VVSSARRAGNANATNLADEFTTDPEVPGLGVATRRTACHRHRHTGAGHRQLMPAIAIGSAGSGSGGTGSATVGSAGSGLGLKAR